MFLDKLGLFKRRNIPKRLKPMDNKVYTTRSIALKILTHNDEK